MARMIPDLDPRLIENDGERRVCLVLRNLGPSFTVPYSYKTRVVATATANGTRKR